MKQWARTPGGDMLFPTTGNGATAIVSDVATCTKIKLTSVLEFVQGEWFLDTKLGFPWKGILGQKKPNLEALRALFRKTILSVSPVVAVDDLSIALDRGTRNISYAFGARLANGQSVSVP